MKAARRSRVALGWLAAAVGIGWAVVRSSAAPLPGNLLLNGDFEQPPGIEGFVVFQGASLPYWVVESGSVEIDGYGWEKANGAQSLDLNGDAPGALYQDVPTTPGQTYRLRYAMSGHPFCGPLVMTLEVRWGGEIVATPAFDRTGKTPEDMGWRYDEHLLTASGTSSRLRFASLTEASCGPLLDDLSLAPEATLPAPPATPSATPTSTATATPTCPPTPAPPVTTPTALPGRGTLGLRHYLPFAASGACTP